MLSIYDYLDPNAFLRDFWEERREADPTFSVRAWAKLMGMKVHGPLHQMIHGKRKIPKKYVPLFIETLCLTASEGLYFDALVDYKKTQKSDEKNYYLNRLREISPFNDLKVLEYRTSEHFRDPLNFMIAEMVTLKEFKNDANWICSQLHYHVEPSQVREVMDRLIDLEILIPSPDGKSLMKKERHNYVVDIPSKAMNHYHQKACHMAKQAMIDLEGEQKEFISFSMNIPQEKLSRAKEMIRNFHIEFVKEFEAEPFEGEQTYNIGLHLYEATKAPIPSGGY